MLPFRWNLALARANSLAHKAASIRCISVRPESAPLSLASLRDNPGARQRMKRVGRGPSSGKGKTAGRGHKGQKSRAGGGVRPGFAGGQTTLAKTSPKRGFHNPEKQDLVALNLDKLQRFIDLGRLDASKPITMYHLAKSRVIHKVPDGVRLLARGGSTFKTKVEIEVSRASTTAIEAVERNGGRVVCRYYNRLGLRALLRPNAFAQLPTLADPSRKLARKYYSDPVHRGYLAAGVEPLVKTWEERLGFTHGTASEASLKIKNA